MMTEGGSKGLVVDMLRSMLFLVAGTSVAWVTADVAFNYLRVADSY